MKVYSFLIEVGELGEERHKIYQAASIEMIPVQLKTRSTAEIDPMLDEVQHESQARCINLLHDVLCTPYFYYSPTLDLTNSMQRLYKQGPLTQPSAAQGKEAWDRLDERFVWNAFALTPFLEVKPNSSDLHAFIMPLIHGALFIRKCNINKVILTIPNISVTDFALKIYAFPKVVRPTKLFFLAIGTNNLVNSVQKVQIQNRH